MTWDQAKDVILGFLGTGAVTIFVYEIHELRSSVNILNEKIAVLIEKTVSHEERIKRLEDSNDVLRVN